MRFRLIVAIVTVAVLCWSGVLLAFRYSRTVKPIKNKEDAVFTTTLYGLAPHDRLSQKLIYTSYAAGFLDAVQLEQVSPGTARRFAVKYNGMTLGDIVNVLDKFYETDPGHRKEKPVNIILRKMGGSVSLPAAPANKEKE